MPASGEEPPARGVGRPKLGVVAREVTLLPRHWDWLSRQPGGRFGCAASADRRGLPHTPSRWWREAAYRAMSVLGSELPRLRGGGPLALAGERARFNSYVSDWPADVAEFVRGLAAPAWNAPAPDAGA